MILIGAQPFPRNRLVRASRLGSARFFLGPPDPRAGSFLSLCHEKAPGVETGHMGIRDELSSLASCRLAQLAHARFRRWQVGLAWRQFRHMRLAEAALTFAICRDRIA